MVQQGVAGWELSASFAVSPFARGDTIPFPELILLRNNFYRSVEQRNFNND